ncbi:polysaccharide deacetylase family protein [Dyadobacter chenwenxiniae]|uniref:Polysaccharide deacetylase family protein n=1 Tax=Dyadobacter chenwenxiniae TaxID=2906456 RepID=A0A9X1PR14_9BACT|nr:sialate O-acetylesterase [Dyadobacter chenwenxiniae]MCF0064544.1 polysaccharide deacetylase family protein [Dyadobacter chenwenxiniae]UON84398.1 polysaccharide deacetylase family protein [Dyadobacter chenwenxiniae]
MRVVKFLLLLIILSGKAFAQVRLPKLVSDNMVLQRDQPITVWGWATPKEKVTVTCKGTSRSAVTGADGKWTILLPAQPAGTGFEMLVKGKNQVRIKNIAFGDVWLCNGQSNMVINMERVKERFPDDIVTADYPDIRNFFIPTATDLNGPRRDFPNAEWKAASPKDGLGFGAVSYFFARDLYDQYKVPIGIINSSVGGTPIEAWISEGGYKDFTDIQRIIDRNKDTSYVNSRKQKDLNNAPKQPKSTDPGLSEHWESEAYQPKGWRNFNIPGYWEDQGLKDLDGVVWFRREFEVPENWIGKPVKLYMGRIVDADQMFVNGKSIGNVTYQYPPRRYEIPAGLLKSGKNTFVIRVTNSAGKGGFVPDKPYFMTANDQQIDLKGTWQYKVGQVFQSSEMADVKHVPFVAQNQPAALFNAMIAPALPMKLKGFLWYQGESNVGDPKPYGALLPALIHDRRRLWNDERLPFLVVQLPNFQDIDFTPAESNMALLREAQNQALMLDNTAVTVTLDLGEWNDIHPLNKKDIGKRLALSARNLAYGEKNVIYRGPTLKSQRITRDKMLLTFDHVVDGIKSGDQEALRWFSLADNDKKFFWANARIVGKDQVELSSETVKTPKYARYAWQDNPEGINFYNSAGLPASPFRTDSEQLDETKPWKGKKCAVVLTYDDALNVHLDHVIPALDSLDLKGSFYLTASSDAARNRIKDWRAAAANGHELGNHTLYHPCDATGPGMSWVKPEYDLSKYSMARIQDEIRMCNAFLKSIDGLDKRTFAFTCGHKKVAEGEFIQTLSDEFIAARAVRHEMHAFEEQNLMDVDCYSMAEKSGQEMISLVKQAQQSGKLLVFLFHGVGGEHALNVSNRAHSELLHYLKENEKDIYVDTMRNVAGHIQHLKK